MNAYVAELQAATEGQIIDWQAFPDRPVAYAMGVHGGVGFHLMVSRWSSTAAERWSWVVNAGFIPVSGFAFTAQEAVDAANAEYARLAADRYPTAREGVA